MHVFAGHLTLICWQVTLALRWSHSLPPLLTSPDQPPLLHLAVPGGLYDGVYAQLAIQRYMQIWLPLLCATPMPERAALVPPLDVAFVWLAHRLAPQSYEQDCTALCEDGDCWDPEPQQAFRFSSHTGSSSVPGTRVTAALWASHQQHQQQVRQATLASSADSFFPTPAPTVPSSSSLPWKDLWKQVTPWGAASEPAESAQPGMSLQPYFPPVPRVNVAVHTGHGSLEMQLLTYMQSAAALLVSTLRPCYLEAGFLRQANSRCAGGGGSSDDRVCVNQRLGVSSMPRCEPIVPVPTELCRTVRSGSYVDGRFFSLAARPPVSSWVIRPGCCQVRGIWCCRQQRHACFYTTTHPASLAELPHNLKLNPQDRALVSGVMEAGQSWSAESNKATTMALFARYGQQAGWDSQTLCTHSVVRTVFISNAKLLMTLITSFPGPDARHVSDCSLKLCKSLPCRLVYKLPRSLMSTSLLTALRLLRVYPKSGYK